MTQSTATHSAATSASELNFDFKNATEELNFSRTIDKDLVHRLALAEVFVTDFETIGRDRFIVAAQLPVGHAVYNDGGNGHHDPLAIIEACRQAALVIAHKAYGVPRDWSFIFRNAKASIEDVSTTRITDGRMLIGVNIARTFEKDGFTTGMLGDFVVEIDGNLVGSFTGSLSFLPKSVMHRMRAASRSTKALPESLYVSPLSALPTRSVGREVSKNIVIGRRGADTYEIIDHSSNRALVDHEVDHVSGMVIMEACRQSAIAATFDETGEMFCTVSSYAVDFTEFAEREVAVTCEATVIGVVDGVAQTHIEVIQQGNVIATAQIDLERTAQNA